MLVELRALLDKIYTLGAIFQVAVAERRGDGARRCAGQASDESTFFLTMDDWAARGAMEALTKALLAHSLRRNCADEGGTGVEGGARVLRERPPSSMVTAAML